MTPVRKWLRLVYAGIPGWRGLAWAGLGLVAGMRVAAAQGADAPAAATPADVFTFTNNEGKQIVAQIMNVVNDTVYLKRQDGQSFEVAIDSFRDEDQAAIRWWAEQQLMQDGAQMFEFTGVMVKANESVTNNVLTWNATYKVKMANQTTLHVMAPVIRYILLVAPQVGQISHQFGTATLEDLPASNETTFDTNPVQVTQYGQGPGIHDINNKLLGVWVRVYDSHNQLLQEWCSSLDYMKSETWDFPAQGRGRRGMGGRGGGGGGGGGPAPGGGA
jgi:hypothetical protein